MAATPSDEIKGLCMGIGFVVINWALIERQLDNWVVLIFHDCGGDTIRKDIPRMTKAKIAFLRRAFRKLEPLQPFKPEALEILRKASEISQKRNDFVHGVVEKVTPKMVEFSRLKHGDRHHQVTRGRFNAKHYPALSESLLGLSRNATEFSLHLLKTIPRRK